MELRLIEQRLAVCRLPADAHIPAGILETPFCAVTRTDDELSIVLPEREAESSWRIDAGWRALKVVGPLAFDMVGVLVSLCTPLADAGIPVFVISTFDTDYLLVKQDLIEQTSRELKACGHSIM